MRYLLAHEPQIHYLQRRPMHLTAWSETYLRHLLDNGYGIAADCSESVTALCRWAGLHDPTGNHFDGYGNTASMYGFLPHFTDPKLSQVGGLCVYGPDGADHVTITYTPGADPLVWSHGAERGPRLVRWSVEKAVHRHPATFLSIARL